MTGWTAAALWAALGPLLPQAAPARREIDLGGAWEYLIVDELAAPPRAGNWRPCAVPGYLNGVDYKRAWFRRSFALPAAWRGLRIKIRFGGVKYNSRVFVNGRPVGGCFGGYDPFEVDATEAVVFDGPNELAVGVHDWTGVFTPGRVDLDPRAPWDRLRSQPRDKILAPIGGLFNLYGIWDEVRLVGHPAIHIKDLFLKTSVRRRELVVEYTLVNESAAEAQVDLAAIVEDQGRDLLRLPGTRLRVPAGGTVSAVLRVPWPGPRLWSPVDPYLYHLRTELSSGDVVRTRFGFREFGTGGHRFFLNGVPVNLLATSWWPPHGPMAREEIRRRWQAVKDAGCVAFRTHTQPWPAVHYDVADEIGLLMIVEGAVWNDDDVYRVHDPVFWENYARHLKAMVDRDKNRPSVVMWSLENEFTGPRLNDATPGPKAQLVRLGRMVKQWDPTRPIYYESDGDPDGIADAIGLHYPHEYPDYTCWPNEAYWLDKPWKGHGGGGFFFNGEPHFLWKKDKPLYIGEFLWLPSSDPSWHTVFYGDDAYIDYRRYRDLGKAESWKMQILGYRHFEVAGISPWTVIEGGPLDDTNPLYRAHRYAYQPVAAFCHDYDRRFYAGDEVRRRVEVFNDLLEPSALDFRWTLFMEGREAGQGRETLKLDPAGHRMLEVVLRMPPAGGRTPVEWRLTLDRNGRRVFEDVHRYAVFPRPRPLVLPARIGLHDPAGGTRKALESLGVRTVDIPSLEEFDASLDVLVIGAGALKARAAAGPVIGRIDPARAALLDFALRGGRVLILEQKAYPEGLFETGLSGHASTMTFPLRPGHPALRGVEPEDLKFWRGDHLVADDETPRPAAGATVPIVVSGSAAGLDHAPLLERPAGRGCFIHCQMKLIEKFSTEPAAARILANLLEYLSGRRAAGRPTAVAGGSEAYRACLRGLGLRFDDLAEKMGPADLSAYGLVVCRGEIGDPEKLLRFVEQGGALLVHRPTAAAFESLSRTFGLDAKLAPYPGPVTRARGDDPLLEAVSREDLYWLGPHVGVSWSETPRAGEVADGAFAKTLEGKKAAVHEVEDWTLEGALVQRQGPGVAFATAGSASGEIDFPEAGDYVLGVVARGTPCRGVYPIAKVAIDGEEFGSVSVTGEQWATYALWGPVGKGRRRVSVAFVNDASDPPREDRNLFVDKVLAARDDSPGGARFLTVPPVIAVVRRGKGVLVIDRLRWDTEEANARKAARHACSLLTALGGDFRPRPSVAVECERMTPQPGLPHFRNAGTFVSLACNGWIKTTIQVAAAGRYTVEVVAGGTECEGVYPLVEVRLDGRKVGQVQLTGGSWRPYALGVELPEGEHELTLAFVNDKSIPGVSDRNLMLDKVLFTRE